MEIKNRLVLSVLFLAVSAYSGPWIPEPGSGSVSLGAAIMQASEISDVRGGPRDYAITELGMNLGVECGIFPGVSAALGWNSVKAIWSDSVDRIGITDPELGLNLRMAKFGGHRIALRISGRIPLGETNPGNVPTTLYALHSQGVWAAELQPQWGWAGGFGWLQAGFGARLRSGGYASQALYSVSGGKSFGAWGPRLNLSGLIPLDTEGNGKPSDQEQYYGVQLALDRKIGSAFKIGFQFDSMLTSGQELPLGLRSNLYLSRKW